VEQFVVAAQDDPELVMVLEAQLARLQTCLAAAKECAKQSKPLHKRRSEIQSQLRELDGKISRNRELCAEAEARAQELRGFVETQTARAGTLRSELHAIALKEADELVAEQTETACIATGCLSERAILEQMQCLKLQLEQVRKSSPQLGANSTASVAVVPKPNKLADAASIDDFAGRNLFGAKVTPRNDEEHPYAERRARSASPGRAVPKATQRRLFGA
jgi:hypothetical protein